MTIEINQDLFMQIDLTIDKYKTMAKNSNTSRKLWAMEVVEDLIRIREAMIKDLK